MFSVFQQAFPGYEVENHHHAGGADLRQKVVEVKELNCNIHKQLVYSETYNAQHNKNNCLYRFALRLAAVENPEGAQKVVIHNRDCERNNIG